MSDIHYVNTNKEEFLLKKNLYKYMSIEHALDSLRNHHLWAANPYEWKDPYERYFLEAKYDCDGQTIDFPWKNKVYCICMTNNQICEAYWKMYSEHSIGMQLRFDRKQLIEKLETLTSNYDIYVSKVKYIKTEELENIQELIKKENFQSKEMISAFLLSVKRIAYKYEDEYRIIFVEKDNIEKDNIEKAGIHIDYGNNSIISRIFLDPTIEKNTEEMLRNTLTNNFNIEKDIIFKSNIYAMPKKTNICIKI